MDNAAPVRDSAATKPCPFCGESILVVAIKCKHCQSSLAALSSPAEAASLRQKAMVHLNFALARAKARPFITAAVAGLVLLGAVGVPAYRQYDNPNGWTAEQRAAVEAHCERIREKYPKFSHLDCGCWWKSIRKTTPEKWARDDGSLGTVILGACLAENE